MARRSKAFLTALARMAETVSATYPYAGWKTLLPKHGILAKDLSIPRAKPGQTSSFVWRHCRKYKTTVTGTVVGPDGNTKTVKTPEQHAFCILCLVTGLRPVFAKSCSTNFLAAHLTNKHEVTEQSERLRATGSTDGAPTNEEKHLQAALWSPARELCKETVLWLVRDLRPFAAAEGEGFRCARSHAARPIVSCAACSARFSTRSVRRTCRRASRWCTWPSASIKQSSISCVRSCCTISQVRWQVRVEMTHLEFAAITTDCWTSEARQGYQGVTVHGITDDFRQVCRVLSVKHLPGALCSKITRTSRAGSHTGVAMAKDQLDVLRSFGLVDKVSASTTDAASNAKCGRSELEALLGAGRVLLELDCKSHMLNLAVKDALSHIDPILRKVSRNQFPCSICAPLQLRNISTFLHKSTQSEEQLEYLQHLNMEKEETMKGYVETRCVVATPGRTSFALCRWGAPYEMCKGYLRSRQSVSQLLAAKGADYLAMLPTPEEWAVLDRVCRVLEVADAVSSALGGEAFATASLVLPLFAGLEATLQVCQFVALARVTSVLRRPLTWKPTRRRSNFCRRWTTARGGG